MKRRMVLALAAALGVWACGRTADPGKAADADTLTRRQKDSIVSTLPIPGAGAVGTAQRASDRAAERARMLDSVR